MESWTDATTAPPTTTDVGILRPELVGRAFALERFACHPALEPYIEHYWAVAWSLPQAAVQPSEVLSHPAVHLTIEEGSADRFGVAMPAALLHGVPTRRFEIGLSGQGRVLGAKFRPGGFAAFSGLAVDGLTDAVRPAESFWPAAAGLLGLVPEGDDDGARCRALDGFLVERLPDPDPRYPEVLAIIADALAERSITTVEELARRHGIGVRTLQRLIRRYVGVGAKWLIGRYRLHDALADLQADPGRDLSELALGLGWYDQAHFTRDFSAAVGTSPARYARRSRDA
ncbi:AraC family transcriptional regulator [Arthrobacter sp. 35W]|uniref:AraC family transcriptional regulator n=1 Tax=Arthrobacter sp. 35W TaxID=1132441 RepID=UPI0003F9328F|nr:AraC family transcriptional regulator [Arthrobacter sp. 35W]